MATIRNYRDIQLQSISPRLIAVPSNTITLVGAGNTFEVRGANTHPSTIIIYATPQGHLIGQACTFTSSGTGHTLSAPNVNTAIVTGDVNGSDIFTVTASVTYKGLTYTSTYTINKINSKNYTTYEVSTSSGSLVYDPGTTSYIPTSISINSVVSTNGVNYTPYAGKFTIHVSSDGGYTWGSAQYTSTNNESSYTYSLTGVTATTSRIRFRLHTAGETPSNSNVLDTTIIPVIAYGYTGSGTGGVLGRSVNIYTGSASTISVYGVDGYLASSLNIPPDAPILCTAQTSGFVGSKYFRWLLDGAEVSAWTENNNTYNYTRKYDSSNMPDVIGVEVADGYTASVYARDYVNIYSTVSTYVGSNNPIFGLSNRYHTVSFNGSYIGSYLNSGTLFWGYEGSTILTFNAESNTYPVVADVGKYNVERTYTNISSGGIVKGTNSYIGSVPEHTNLIADQATLTLTFRTRKLNGDTAAEVYDYQTIFRSITPYAGVIGSGYIASGPITVSTVYTGSNLPYSIDFTDLIQTFWPGDVYISITSGDIAFSRKFEGQTDTFIERYTGSNYVGSGFNTVLTSTPTNPLTLFDYTGSLNVIGVACDPMDHPVLFGIEQPIA
jgi:hypothetical protein